MPPPDEPKLIIDSDWKAQAQAEKERLAQKAAAAKPATMAGSVGKGGAEIDAAPGSEGRQPGEPVKFDDLVALLATQALSYMGYFADPRTGQAVVSLEYARLHIDMLGILEEKTKGNLSPDEQAALTRTVGELRMSFVELSKAVAKAVQEGKIRPMSGGPGGTAGGPSIATPGQTGLTGMM
jgi:hypothetical protein